MTCKVTDIRKTHPMIRAYSVHSQPKKTINLHGSYGLRNAKSDFKSFLSKT